jgi:hypothetical protein
MRVFVPADGTVERMPTPEVAEWDRLAAAVTASPRPPLARRLSKAREAFAAGDYDQAANELWFTTADRGVSAKALDDLKVYMESHRAAPYEDRPLADLIAIARTRGLNVDGLDKAAVIAALRGQS